MVSTALISFITFKKKSIFAVAHNFLSTDYIDISQMIPFINATALLFSLLLNASFVCAFSSDFLLLVLKDLILQRPDMRIILMSATLNANLFSEYFYNCPSVHIPGRNICKVLVIQSACITFPWIIFKSKTFLKISSRTHVSCRPVFS